MPFANFAALSSVKQLPGPDAIYTTQGTYNFVVPAGVTSISAVLVGPGGGAGSATGTNDRNVGGGGGGLRYINNLPVTPGETITVVVGNRSTGWGFSVTCGTSGNPRGTAGTASRLLRGANVLVEATPGSLFNPTLNTATGGSGTAFGAGPFGGTIGGGNGGSGGLRPVGGTSNGGGGGAGGYSGNGGGGANSSGDGVAGSGGGGGGGASSGSGTANMAGGGGGVGLYGQGANGAGGINSGVLPEPYAGRGGSGGLNGKRGGGSNQTNLDLREADFQENVAQGGGFGGGAGSGAINCSTIQQATFDGGGGAVRIIWGVGKSFPFNAV